MSPKPTGAPHPHVTCGVSLSGESSHRFENWTIKEKFQHVFHLFCMNYCSEEPIRFSETYQLTNGERAEVKIYYFATSNETMGRRLNDGGWDAEESNCLRGTHTTKGSSQRSPAPSSPLGLGHVRSHGESMGRAGQSPEWRPHHRWPGSSTKSRKRGTDKQQSKTLKGAHASHTRAASAKQ